MNINENNYLQQHLAYYVPTDLKLLVELVYYKIYFLLRDSRISRINKLWECHG